MARKTSFYYSFLVLPADQRPRDHRGLGLLPRGGRCGGRERTTPDRPVAARRRLRSGARSWRAATTAAAPQTPQGRRLQPFITRFDLPREAFEDVIDGVAMDLDTTRYQTFDDLLEYCRRVASAVGLICIRIFGCRDPRAREYALNLGVALQLTNILRDIKDDLARGRVYLPLEDLAAAGCTVERSRGGRMTAPVRRLHRVRVPPRPRVLSARRRRPAGAGSPPSGRRRDHAGGLLRDAAPHRAARLRRLFRPRARAASAPGADRAQAMALAANDTTTRSSSAPASPA